MTAASAARRRRRRPARWAAGAIAALAITLVAAACGIDAQESAQPINPDILGGLDQTVPPPTDDAGPLPTLPSSSVEPPASTTPDSSLPGPMVDATMYFIEGPALTPVTVSVPEFADLLTFLRQLETGPPQEQAEAGIRSAIPADLVVSVREFDDVVTVDFDPTVFQEIEGRDRPLLIGQVVLTLDADDHPRVRFTLAGEFLPVPSRDGSLTNDPDYVTRSDYEELIATDDSDEVVSTSSTDVGG